MHRPVFSDITHLNQHVEALFDQGIRQFPAPHVTAKLFQHAGISAQSGRAYMWTSMGPLEVQLGEVAV